MLFKSMYLLVRLLKGIAYDDEHEYDDAIADNTNHDSAQSEENSLRLQTISNPYYGGNDYVSLHGIDQPENDERKKVDTLKIVNNVYYE